MNVFEYAKKMELDGIHFYQTESERTNSPGFKKILQLLINEEQNHYSFFDMLQQNLEPGELPAFPVNVVENVFRELWKNGEGFDFSAAQVEVYRKALEIERQSERFYRTEAAKAEKEGNEELKKQLLMVAEEEKKHTILMDGLVEYLARPGEWVEHAMFTQPRPEY
ncbi:MAG: ferritin family protein [Victivallaceae bacterium]|jgi:rubrerythrin